MNKSWKNIRNLGFVSFFTDISSEMIFGILPIFIIDELGAGKAVLGVIEGMGESVGYGTRAVSGSVSDKIGKRKPLVFLGYALSTVTKPFFALSGSWSHVFAIRTTERIGKGIRTSPRDALISESAEPSQIGKAFGFHKSLDQAGAIIGPMLAFGLLFFVGIRDIFWLSLIPGAAALFILLFYVKETKTKITSYGMLTNFQKVLHGRFLVFLCITGVFSLGAFNFAFVLVESTEIGLEIGFVPLVYVLINIAHTAIGYPSGVLADKIGHEKFLLLGFGMFFVTSLIGFLDTQSMGWIVIMAVVFGLYHGITITNSRAIISKLTGDLKGTAFGVFYLVIGVSFLIANSIFGYLWDVAGSQSAFTYSIITSSLGMIGLSVFVLWRK